MKHEDVKSKTKLTLPAAVAAAWIADTGRFSDALESCNFSEVEPFPNNTAILNTMSIIDASPIKDLPTVQK